MALFTLDQVLFRQVLEIDHLEIAANEVTSIVGKSGSGKSTLLRLLNRMITPDSGQIMYRSEPIDQINPVDLRRRVVMLPQNPVIFEGSVRENVLIGLEFSERPHISNNEISRLLELMDINRPPDSSAANLSGGERQRVGIARVLAMQPEVLLLDEPTSALDASTQDVVIEHLMTEAQTCNTSVVMVTHATAMAARWSDRIVEIQAGRVAATTSGGRYG